MTLKEDKEEEEGDGRFGHNLCSKFSLFILTVSFMLKYNLEDR